MARIAAMEAEWLEPDGLGGFASGTVSGVRTRRYHALLLASRTPPTDRFVLVNGLDAWLTGGECPMPLCAHRYAPDVLHPRGDRWVESFVREPWPTWTYRLPDRTRVQHEVFVPRGRPMVVLSWRLLTGRKGAGLSVRPLMSVRDYHATHHENPGFNAASERRGDAVVWRPYYGVPSITARTNGVYREAMEWYRRFLYAEEVRRGLDAVEDLASPGHFEFDLSAGEAWMILSADTPREPGTSGEPTLEELRRGERARRSALGTGLAASAQAYVVSRGLSKSIIAGYPWFTDWGRDTFISVRGLCLATGRLEEARSILGEWSRFVVDGMLPNRFPDAGTQPEYHSVDAALWFVQAAWEFLDAAKHARLRLEPGEEESLRSAVRRIVAGHLRGARHGVRVTEDGLLAAGERGTSLTWMDARVDGRAITPRVGKPVEVQALWINAARIAAEMEPKDAKLDAAWRRALASFRERFWNAERGMLHDVVDTDHAPGAVDSSLRPNQVFAVGGLRWSLLDAERAAQVVEVVERELWTPMGLRTLGPREPGYRGRFEGGPLERDTAYHNGTAWPWLLGPFVEAWVRVRGGTPEAKREARERFVEPLVRNAEAGGLGHIAEVADGDAPHRPGGCPFQAWSVGEVLRVERVVLAEGKGNAEWWIA
ncbi:MAG: glycogen debranching enzyme family protein [Phycisphaeraceae bacterium]|nr:glycogen debranching enzyme family protein [Phycisphaeraceae bacterium]